MDPETAFERLRTHCLAKPNAVEEYPWGDTVWKVGGKMFASGGKTSGRYSVKATPDEQSALIQLPEVEVAAYVGRYGWVTVTVESESALELAKDLIDRSYEHVLPKSKRAKSS